MPRNRNNTGTRTGSNRRRAIGFAAGIILVLLIVGGVMAYMGDLGSLHLPRRSHHKTVVVPPPANVADAEDNTAPACADLGTDIFNNDVKLQNTDDQPILNDNADHYAPQYTCIYKKDGKTYTVGTSKEKPLPKKKSTEKTQPDPLFAYIVTKYTYDPDTNTGDSKLSAHSYTAVVGYDSNISEPVRKVVKTAKVFIYDENQVRGGAFKCGNVIVSIFVDSDITIRTMNSTIAAALKNPVFKECSK